MVLSTGRNNNWQDRTIEHRGASIVVFSSVSRFDAPNSRREAYCHGNSESENELYVYNGTCIDLCIDQLSVHRRIKKVFFKICIVNGMKQHKINVFVLIHYSVTNHLRRSYIIVHNDQTRAIYQQ